MFTITQEDLEEEQKKSGVSGTPLTPLEFLLSCSYNSKDFRQIALEAFAFFIKEPVTFLYDYKVIVIGDPEMES
jgi:hypothetical protein